MAVLKQPWGILLNLCRLLINLDHTSKPGINITMLFISRSLTQLNIKRLSQSSKMSTKPRLHLSTQTHWEALILNSVSLKLNALMLTEMLKRPRIYFTISQVALRKRTLSLETRRQLVMLKKWLKHLLGFHPHHRKDMRWRDCLMTFQGKAATSVLSVFHTQTSEALS